MYMAKMNLNGPPLDDNPHKKLSHAIKKGRNCLCIYKRANF
jgi:hypothetical protein